MRKAYKFSILIIIILACRSIGAFAQCFTITTNNNGPVCFGSSAIISGSVSSTSADSFTYSWTGPGLYTSTSLVNTLSAPLPGTYVLTVTDTTGCTATDSTILVVNPLPDSIIGDSVVCQGSGIVLTDSSTYVGLPGTWSSSNTKAIVTFYGGTTGEVTDTITALVPGIDTITYTLSDGCKASITITIDSTPTITGSASVCLGSVDTLHTSSFGGIWGTVDTTIAAIDSIGIITTDSVGIVHVIYTSPAGCIAHKNVTIDPIPHTISGDSVICSGTTTSLVDTPTTGGTWSSTPSTVGTINDTTGVLTGIDSGKVIVTYTLAGGCFVKDTITVNPSPKITGITGICLGLTTTFTVTPTTGTWTNADSTIATISSAGVVTSVAAGVDTFTYTLSSGCAATITFTVNPVPAVIEGMSALCAGTSISLIDTPTTGGKWSTSPTSIATIDSTTGLLAAISDGTVIATYTLRGACSVKDTITVNPSPKITGISKICLGLATTFTVTPSSGIWSNSDTSIATIDSAGHVSSVSIGVDTISYTLGTGCATAVSFTVNPVPGPITGPVALCANSNITLSDTTAGGKWSTVFPAVATIDSTTGVLSGVFGGQEVATYTLPGGCAARDTITVDSLPVITGSSSVCLGLTRTEDVAPTGGIWQISDTAIATIDNAGVLTSKSVGMTDITYTSVSGCATAITFTVNPSPGPVTGPGSVCQGFTIGLTNTTTGGTWSTSFASIATIDASSGLLAGIAGGTVAATYTLPAGCASAEIITVNPTPTIAGATSVCLNATTTFTVSPTGGTWDTPDTTVTVSTSGLVTGVTVGAADITYTSLAGCTNTKTITVNPLPAPVTGPTKVCVGLTISFTDDTTGGTWSSTPSATATIDAATGVLKGIAGGRDTVTYTLSTGCFSQDTVRVNPLPATITGPDSVCFGLSVDLGETTTGGTWSSGDTSVASVNNSGTVTSVAVGSTTITYTLITGCLRAVPMEVNPLPGPVTGAAPVCVNASITLTDSSTTGTWSTSPTTVATITPVTGILTGVSSGTVSVVYTLHTTCQSSAVVTVNPIPAAFGGTLAVCASGSTTDLTESTTPGTWSITPTSEATIDSNTGIVTGISAGLATVSYTLPVTGCYLTAAFTVNPLPLPITGTGTVCASSTLSLSDGTGGGTWSIVPTSVATISNTGVVTGVSEGAAEVTYTLSTGCLVTDSVFIDPQPGALITPVGDTQICPGSFVALTANTGPGLTYQWLDPGAISGATSSTYVATSAGAYEVKVTNGLGCSLTSPAIGVTVHPISTYITSGGSAVTECQGGGLTLIDSTLATGTSYQWLRNGVSIPGAESSTYIVEDSSGSYSAVVSNAAGCSATSNVINITVYPNPGDTVTGAADFCAGDSAILTADSGAGYVYQWYYTPNPLLVLPTIIAGANSRSFFATTSGYFQAQVTNAFGCTSYTGFAKDSVLPLPVSTITSLDSAVFCPGGRDTLVGPPGLGLYQWYNNGEAIPGATDSLFIDSTSGNFTLKVTNLSTCRDSTLIVTSTTEIPQPEIIPLTPTSFCWGGGATLSENVVSVVPGVIHYQWFFDGTHIPGATGPTYVSHVGGYYTCSVTAGSCSLKTDSVTVIEFPLPNPLIGYDGTKLSTGGFYITYQWYKDLAPIAGATDSSFAPTANGNYAVKVTDTNGCQSISDVYVLSDLSVSNVNSANIKIYPNPAQGTLHISSAISVRAQITGMDGRILLTQKNAKDMDISNLANGIYMVTIYNDNGQVIKTDKVIKTAN